MIAARLPFCTQLRSFWGDSGSVYGRFRHHVWRVKNIEKPDVFFGFCYFWGAGKGWLKHLGGCLRRCCLQERIFLASWGHLETMLRHVGAKMAIKSAKVSHHRRKSVLQGTRGGAMDSGRVDVSHHVHVWHSTVKRRGWCCVTPCVAQYCEMKLLLTKTE